MSYRENTRAPNAREVAVWLLIVLCLPITFPATGANAGTYTATVDRDSWLNSAAAEANTNYGTSAELQLRANTDGSVQRIPIYHFSMPAIPANEQITSAFVRLWVRNSDNGSATIHRVTGTWSQNSVTWNNTGSDFAATAETSFIPSTANAFVTADLTSLARGWRNGSIANNGLMIRPANNADARFTSREWGTSAQRPQLVINTEVVPPITVAKSSQTYMDPYNASTNPKAIPGAYVYYTINVANPASYAITSNSIVVTDATPAGLRLYVSDIPGAAGPVLVTPNGSGVTYTYVGLASMTDDVDFSNNGGATWTYVPSPNADLVDAAVTHVRVRPKGVMAAGSNFTLYFGYRID